MNKQSEPQLAKLNPAVQQLDALVGEWNVTATHPLFPEGAQGRSSFTWLQEGGLLIWRSDFGHPGPPSAISVIGYDDSAETYSMVYFDERPVSRIYGMSLEGNVWKFWRESPGFSQRFTGTLSNDGNSITGLWEKSTDGLNWEHDLQLTFTRVK